MTLKVIGTGFGRTGTDSMRTALEILGVKPCHHMREIFGDSVHKQHWRDLAAGGPADWDLLLGKYRACVDWPSAHYWPELIALYPDAKVLLTWRSAESWWASFEKTILQSILADPDQNSLGSLLLTQRVFGSRIADRDHCIAVYEANVAAVKATVPADRLLIHNLGDGWEPLCAHLGVPTPNAPYPRANSTADFMARARERSDITRK